MTPKADVTACIGHTPLVQLSRYYPASNGVAIYAKLEYLNPGGSVKDRIGLSMIEDAEERGVLQTGGTVIEATAGNTGLGVALVAAVRGYRCICVIPDSFSAEKQSLIRAMGAEVENTPAAQGMERAIARAQELATQIPGAVVMQQFANPANARAHYKTTGPEIWEELEGRVDVVVLGAGSGGTFTGAVRFLKECNPNLYGVIVQPYGASLGQGHAGPHKVEGIGVDKLETARILDTNLIDRMVVVRDEEAHSAVAALARREGMLVGGSSGAAAHAACLIADEIATGRLKTGGQIVTLFPDGADRYLSEHIFGTFEAWTR